MLKCLTGNKEYPGAGPSEVQGAVPWRTTEPSRKRARRQSSWKCPLLTDQQFPEAFRL